jgi:hypothetical protein
MECRWTGPITKTRKNESTNEDRKSIRSLISCLATFVFSRFRVFVIVWTVRAR